MYALGFFLTSSTILLFLTLLPLLRTEVWWVRALDFPRLQLCAVAAVLLVAGALLLERDRVAALLILASCLGCLAWHGWWIFPYTRLSRKEVCDAAPSEGDNSNCISILTSNVLGENRNGEGLLELVRQYKPDLLLTLESGPWWQQQLDQLQEHYPYTVKCPLDNLYGMHLYSKLKLSEAEIEYLLEDDIPSIHTLVHLRSGVEVVAHFLHPRPPAPQESDSSAKRDAELIIVGKSVDPQKGPVIVAGDLNDVAWSRTTRLFRKLSGLLDPRIGRGMFNTFHAEHWYLRWPLDHLFHSQHFTVRKLARLPAFGSDHFPLYSELVYEGPASNPDSGLELEADDVDLAEEKTEDMDVDVSEVPHQRAD